MINTFKKKLPKLGSFFIVMEFYLSGTGCMSPVFIRSKTEGKNITRMK